MKICWDVWNKIKSLVQQTLSFCTRPYLLNTMWRPDFSITIKHRGFSAKKKVSWYYECTNVIKIKYFSFWVDLNCIFVTVRQTSAKIFTLSKVNNLFRGEKWRLTIVSVFIISYLIRISLTRWIVNKITRITGALTVD